LSLSISFLSQKEREIGEKEGMVGMDEQEEVEE
jgi:hypothetical protein